MNPIQTPPPPEPNPADPLHPQPPPPGSEPPVSPITSPPGKRRRTGKIAVLPKPIREEINLMLENGLPYRAIIEKLEAPGAPPLPHPITEHNLSEWKDGGYQDWLKDQFWQDELRAKHESFVGVLSGTDPVQLPEGALQFATVGLCELLRDLSPGAPGFSTADNAPDRYIRAANSLARLTGSVLHLQHYREACARARAALQPMKDPKRQLSPSETRAIVRNVDRILGLTSEDLDDLDQAQPPGPPVRRSAFDAGGSTLDAGRAVSPKAPPHENPNPPSTN